MDTKPFSVVVKADVISRLTALQVCVNDREFRGWPPRSITLLTTGVNLGNGTWSMTLTPTRVTADVVIMNADGTTGETLAHRESADFSFIEHLVPLMKP